MDEADYRVSRFRHLLRSPIVYQLIALLDRGGAMTPSKLGKAVGGSVQTVSGLLAKLRAADELCNDTTGKEVGYWLKHKGETRGLLRSAREAAAGLQQSVVRGSLRRIENSQYVEGSEGAVMLFP